MEFFRDLWGYIWARKTVWLVPIILILVLFIGLIVLAGGSALMGFGAFMIIGYWAFRNPDIYGAVVNPLDLAVLASAFALAATLVPLAGWLADVGGTSLAFTVAGVTALVAIGVANAWRPRIVEPAVSHAR